MREQLVPFHESVSSNLRLQFFCKTEKQKKATFSLLPCKPHKINAKAGVRARFALQPPVAPMVFLVNRSSFVSTYEFKICAAILQCN